MIAVVAAVLIGLACAGLASAFSRPDRPAERRLAPHTQFGRARLGAPSDAAPALGADGPAGVATALSSPFVHGARRLMEQGVDVAADEQLTTRLRRSGELDARPETYRRMQLRWGVGGAVGCSALFASMAGASGGAWQVAAVVGFATGVPAGALWYRWILEQRAASRAKQLRLEVYTVTLVLSVLCRAGVGPITAVRAVAKEGGGVLCADLRHGMHWMQRGASGLDVLDRLARETPEPSVARLLRLLAGSTATGTSPSRALRDMADQLRKQRIEQLDQWATKRRAAMLIPTMVFMFPVIVLFALAPGPSVIFGI